MECHSGYGADAYCESAREKIKKACGCPDAKVEFLTGGMQTNALVNSWRESFMETKDELTLCLVKEL
jgi:threonine aldolase